jgi:hypothetical protein
MSQKRIRLSVSRETLRELNDQGLGEAAGGLTSLGCTPAVRTLPLDVCLSPISTLFTNVFSCG